MGFLTLMAVVRMSEVLRRDTFLRRLILAFIGIGFILVPVCCWRLFSFMSHMEEITVGGKVANDRSLAVYVELGTWDRKHRTVFLALTLFILISLKDF